MSQQLLAMVIKGVSNELSACKPLIMCFKGHVQVHFDLRYQNIAKFNKA